MKYKFALIGKGINHSRSPSLYKEILGEKLEEYSLLDYDNVENIPPLKELLESYNGVNITSPYKKIERWNECYQVLDVPKNLGVYNVAKKSKGQVFVSNTDFLALKEILPSLIRQSKGDVIILGDGAMASITKNILEGMNKSYKVLSRRQGNLTSLTDLLEYNKENALVLNACSREFLFKGVLSKNSIFYDYNYNNPDQRARVEKAQVRYVDGTELLERQANLALKFWFSPLNS